VHRDRRGTTAASGPSAIRTGRGGACVPAPAQHPIAPGQVSSPPASCRSTDPPSPSTVSTTPPSVNPAALPGTSPKTAGRACWSPTAPYQDTFRDLGKHRLTIDRDRHRDHKTKARQAFPAARTQYHHPQGPATITVCGPRSFGRAPAAMKAATP
jgi:hypothetical protein